MTLNAARAATATMRRSARTGLRSFPYVSAEAAIYAGRVMPSFLARQSISAIWLPRAVILNRTVLSATSTFTKNATAPLTAGSSVKASSVEASGIASRSFQRFRRQPARLVERLAGRHTNRKIGEAHPVIPLPVSVRIPNVFHAFAPFQTSCGDVSLRVRDLLLDCPFRIIPQPIAQEYAFHTHLPSTMHEPRSPSNPLGSPLRHAHLLNAA